MPYPPAGGRRAEPSARTLRYKAWGEDRAACASPPCGTTPTTWRYTGQRVEAGIGLYYYGARWYDASLSRFVQADTVVPSPGDPQSLNRYSYVRNSPLLHTDPSGHREMNLADQARYEWTNQDLYYGAAYYDTGWGTGWTAHDTGVVVQGLGLIAATAVVPEIIGAAAEGVTALIEAGTAATAAGTACAATDCLDEAQAGVEAVGEAAEAVKPLLEEPAIQFHHIFPQQFGDFFSNAGVKIHDFTVALEQTTHLSGVHGEGGFVGPGGVTMPGGWNALWDAFIRANPMASAKEIYQYAGDLMDQFGLSGLPIVPYPNP
jgi:RHS repeat-associated protein